MIDLAKKYQCPCGSIKRIKWESKKEYENGRLVFAVGHSTCRNCDIVQVHFSGDPNYIQSFMDNANMNDWGMDGLEIDKRSCH